VTGRGFKAARGAQRRGGPGCWGTTAPRGSARGRAPARRARRRCRHSSGCATLNAKISKNFNRTPANFEYQSYRASIGDYFSQRLTYVLINHLSMNCRQSCWFSWLGWIVFPAVDQVFHPITLQIWNATQKQSCVPRKTDQLLYWEILKCLGEIWRTRQKF
jgi:hypothetical protein